MAGSRDRVATLLYAQVLARARSDNNVLGVVLAGSRGAGVFQTDASDFDPIVVLRADDGSWPKEDGAPVEVWAVTLDAFRTHALVGNRNAWNRPAFLYVRVELDKLDGEIEAIVERKRTLSAGEADALIRQLAGDYINSLYRSLKNIDGGRELAGRLDALESIPPLLTALFAVEGRVRPFNKYLRHELERRPLAIGDLAERVDKVVREPTPRRQRRLFRDVESVLRGAGHGPLIDEWEPRVAYLRHAR